MSSAAPPAFQVHLALIATQLSFGGGSIVGKFGVTGTNPVLFAAIREGSAGPILWLASVLKGGRGACLPQAADICQILAAGFFLYSNQFFFIVGVKLADPVSGSAWQLTQPIFTLLIAVLVGFERLSSFKIAGITVSIAGALFLVLYNAGGGGSSSVAGQLCFCFNCLGTSCYIIATKTLLRKYQALSVTAWAYLCGSIMMVLTCLIFNVSPALIGFVCQSPNVEDENRCLDGRWSVPLSMVLPLLYWVLFNSLVAYFLMTWANGYAKPSVVSVYTVIQPLTSGVISALLIAAKGQEWGSRYGLQQPGLQDLGIILIFAGLLIMFREPSMDASSAGKDNVPPRSLGLQEVDTVPIIHATEDGHQGD